MDYFNVPELNGKYLGTITKDFATGSGTYRFFPTPTSGGNSSL